MLPNLFFSLHFEFRGNFCPPPTTQLNLVNAHWKCVVTRRRNIRIRNVPYTGRRRPYTRGRERREIVSRLFYNLRRTKYYQHIRHVCISVFCIDIHHHRVGKSVMVTMLVCQCLQLPGITGIYVKVYELLLYIDFHFLLKFTLSLCIEVFVKRGVFFIFTEIQWALISFNRNVRWNCPIYLTLY